MGKKKTAKMKNGGAINQHKRMAMGEPIMKNAGGTVMYSRGYGVDEKGQITEQIFDLNGQRGRKELLKARNSYIKKLAAILRLARRGDDGAFELLQEACEPDAPYLAFARKYIEPELVHLRT